MSPPRKTIEEITEPCPMRREMVPLIVSHPEIAAHWNYAKNCGWGPEDFSRGSTVKVWWNCDRSPDHVFQQGVRTRVLGASHSTNGCPFCKGYRISPTNWLQNYPKVARELHTRKNGNLSAKNITAGSSKNVWWLCKTCNHEWLAKPASRVRGQGCPRCNHGAPCDLRAYPKALKMFDFKRNAGIDPHRLQRHDRPWWQCPVAKDHHFQQTFAKGRGTEKPSCPFCLGRRASSTNNLTKIPKLARQFHPTKNGKLRPRDVNLGTHRIIWWKCSKGPDHEWQASVAERVRKRIGCPCCSKRKLSVTNSLAAFPDIAKDWDRAKNGGRDPKEVSSGSSERVHWRCTKCKYEWKAKIRNRVLGEKPCIECRLRSGGYSRVSDRMRAKMAAMLNTHSVAQIAREFKVHIMTVYRLRDKLRK